MYMRHLIHIAMFAVACADHDKCAIPPGGEFIHSQRVYRKLSEDTFEVISIRTLWLFSHSPDEKKMSGGIVRSRLLMSEHDRSKDVRTTEFLRSDNVEYSADNVTCGISFGDAWYRDWTGKRYVYNGDVSVADIDDSSVTLNITGESEVDISVSNKENKYVLDVYNGLHQVGEELETFGIRVLDGADNHSEGSVTLRQDFSKTTLLWVYRDDYRMGTGEGSVSIEDVKRVLGEKEFVKTDLAPRMWDLSGRTHRNRVIGLIVAGATLLASDQRMHTQRGSLGSTEREAMQGLVGGRDETTEEEEEEFVPPVVTTSSRARSSAVTVGRVFVIPIFVVSLMCFSW